MTSEDCSDVFARLSEYLDRELPDASCEEIERHIAGCAPCIQFVESLRKSIRLTHGIEAVEGLAPLPQELKEKLRRAFDTTLKRSGQ
jgi:anti-sigma factor (TIGR02949 family)